MSWRSGLTTGTCAAAAAKAAATVLAGGAAPSEIELQLPSGQSVRLPILRVETCRDGTAVTASVRKDAGDDPDATHGLQIRVTVSWEESADVLFVAGEGVGTVTKPGLQIPPGQPAINPVPRQMITAAIRAVTPRGVRVEVAIPGGREVAAQTFNPRLGIAGGLSILGTTGVVRPYCVSALRDALKCSLDVAAACGETALVFVPGNIGARAARRHFALRDEQLIEVGNEWGFLLDQLVSPRPRGPMTRPSRNSILECGDLSPLSGTPGPAAKLTHESNASGTDGEMESGDKSPHSKGAENKNLPAEGEKPSVCEALLVLGHPGKLAKLADGQWDTHSARSQPPLEIVRRLCLDAPSATAAGLVFGPPTDRTAEHGPTVEGLFASLPPPERKGLAELLSQRIRAAVSQRLGQHLPVAVWLVNMAGECLGSDGDLSPWR